MSKRRIPPYETGVVWGCMPDRCPPGWEVAGITSFAPRLGDLFRFERKLQMPILPSIRELHSAPVLLDVIARLAGNVKKRQTVSGVYDLDDFLDALGDWIFEAYGEDLALAFDRRIQDISQEGP